MPFDISWDNLFNVPSQLHCPMHRSSKHIPCRPLSMSHTPAFETSADELCGLSAFIVSDVRMFHNRSLHSRLSLLPIAKQQSSRHGGYTWSSVSACQPTLQHIRGSYAGLVRLWAMPGCGARVEWQR